MEVLADLLRRPVLDAAELEREKGVIGQEIAEAADTPDDRVFEIAQAQAFAGQALGRPILGEDDTLAPATRDDARRLARGPLPRPRPAGRQRGGRGGRGRAAAPRPRRRSATSRRPPVPPPEPDAARFVGGAQAEARKLEQAHLVLLMPGVSVRHEDHMAQRLFAEILGGGMASRLFQEAREERGLAYAIDAYAEAYEDVGMVGVYAGHVGGGRQAPGRTGRRSRWPRSPPASPTTSWPAPAPRPAPASSWAARAR